MSGTGTVLILDGSLTVRMDLAQALDAVGFRTRGCATAAQARKLLGHEPVDVIIFDAVLPDADGIEFLREVRAEPTGVDTVVLMLSSEEDVKDRIRAGEAGVDEYVGKPYDVAHVVARTEELTRRRKAGQVSTAGARVLAVDDSLTFLHAVADMLRAEGYDVLAASSGEEALEVLARASRPVDCILLDLLMPGLSGQETCRQIKSTPGMREVPLIMLTSLEDRQAVIEALAVGADDYVPKSGEFEVLAARIRAQVRRKQSENDTRRIREAMLRAEIQATQARAALELAETRAALIGELQRRNQELETFSYSVSHDLRAPLRSIDGFSQILQEECAGQLDDTGTDCLRRIRGAAHRMGELIDDLIALSRVNLAELSRSDVDLSGLVHAITDELAERDPDRHVAVDITDGLIARADSGLIRAALENLLGNAWKFTAKVASPRVEFGVEFGAEPGEDATVYRIRDNGAGFDMGEVQRLFTPFQRLHTESDFPGTGIGLATVRRVFDRHGGLIWAESGVGEGATFRFTIPSPRAGTYEHHDRLAGGERREA